MDESKMDNIYILYDEEGTAHEFELLDTCEMNGVHYYAMVPAEEKEKNSKICEYVILKDAVINGEETMISVEDDDEFDDVADYFDDLFSREIDYDAT